jgi:MFS family permease
VTDVQHDSSHGFFSLPKPAQRYLVATLVNMAGNGMLWAFLYVYFTDVRGFSSKAAGLIIGASTLSGILVGSVGGWLVDRLGAKKALIVAMCISIVVFGSYTWASSVPLAFVVSISAGIASGLTYPAQQAFLSLIVLPHQRPQVSSWLRVMLNVGVALGMTVSGFLLDKDRPSTFTVMFFVNVATFVAYLAIVLGVHPVTQQTMSDRKVKQPGYSAVFADSFFMRLLGLDLAAGLLFGLGFMVMPSYWLPRLGSTPLVIGLVGLCGTVGVITAQIPVSKYAKGRPRLQSLSLMYVLFGVGFVFALIGTAGSYGLAVAMVACAQLAAALGECFLGPTRTPLTADLAPPHLIGRYYGLASVMFQGGMGIAQAVGGVGLDWSTWGMWTIGLAIAVAGTVWSLRLDRQIPAAVRLSP